MFVGSFRIISSEADTVAPLKVSEAETDAVISSETNFIIYYLFKFTNNILPWMWLYCFGF